MKSVIPIFLLCSIGSVVTEAETWGDDTSATGSYSTAWGADTLASGSLSTSWGSNNEASGSRATAWGVLTEASGYASTSWGINTTAIGSYSTAWGRGNEAYGAFSTAWGNDTVADSYYSTAMGNYTIASGRSSVAMGEYNVEFPDVHPSFPEDDDPLLSIGNGTSDSNRSNALTVLRDGTTTINGDVFVYGAVYELSDISLKSHVAPLYFSEDLVMDLNPVSYVMTDDPEQRNQIGFIAQEVEQVLPEIVGESIDGYKTVDYAKMTTVLVGAFQALKKENSLLVADVNTLKAEKSQFTSDIEILKKENALLKDAICKITRRAEICR